MMKIIVSAADSFENLLNPASPATCPWEGCLSVMSRFPDICEMESIACHMKWLLASVKYLEHGLTLYEFLISNRSTNQNYKTGVCSFQSLKVQGKAFSGSRLKSVWTQPVCLTLLKYGFCWLWLPCVEAMLLWFPMSFDELSPGIWP